MPTNIKAIFHKYTGVKIRSVVEISTGLSNINYKINDAYIFRYKPIYRDPTLNYKNELKVIKSIEKLSISEKIVYFNANTGLKISKFIHGARAYIAKPTQQQLILAAKALKKLHNAKIDVGFNYDYLGKLDVYKKELPSYFLLNPELENDIISSYLKVYDKEKLVLCHNDLVQNNLLFKYNEVFLIDWEYSSMNPLIFDLASFISENNLSFEDGLFFLKKYYGKSFSKSKEKKVNITIKALDVLFYYWSQYMFIKKGDSIYITIANDKYNRITNKN